MKTLIKGVAFFAMLFLCILPLIFGWEETRQAAGIGLYLVEAALAAYLAWVK